MPFAGPRPNNPRYSAVDSVAGETPSFLLEDDATDQTPQQLSTNIERIRALAETHPLVETGKFLLEDDATDQTPQLSTSIERIRALAETHPLVETGQVTRVRNRATQPGLGFFDAASATS